MNASDRILVWVFILVATPAWSDVFLRWTSAALPPAKELGLNEVVFSWTDSLSSQVKAARRLGYRVYVEVPLNRAISAAETGATGLEGIILIARHSETAELEKSLPNLRLD
jgi:hypothetical protein